MIIRMAMDGAAAMAYLIKGKFRYFWAVMRAHAALYANMRRLLRQRKECKPNPIKMHKAMLNGSMVWRYMAKKQKTFNKIFS